MKKIFLLLLWCLSLIGTTAVAQTFTVSDAPTLNEDGSYTFADNTYWYTMLNRDGNYYVTLASTSSDGYLTLTASSLNTSDADQDLWCVVGDNTNGYRFYNRSAGAGKVLGVTYFENTSAAGEGGNARAQMIDYSSSLTNSTAVAGTGYLFIQATTSYTDGNGEVFCLKDATNYYLNNRTGATDQVKYLSYWISSSAPTVRGSTFIFTYVPTDEFEIALTNVKDAIDNASVGDQPFQYSQDALTALETVYNQYKDYTASTIGDSKETATTALTNALETYLSSNSSSFQVLVGNLQHSSFYMRAKESTRTSGYGNGYYLGAATNPINYRYLFTFIKDSDNSDGKHYFIYSDYYGKYVGAVPANNDREFLLVDEANRQSFAIEASTTDGYCYIYDDGCSYTSGNYSVIAFHMTDWTSTASWLGSGVVRWTTASNAGQFKLITDIDTYTSKWNASLTTAAKKIISTGYTSDAITALSTALNTFESNKTGVNAQALETAINAAATELGNSTYYFTFTNATTSSEMLTESYDASNSLTSASQTNKVPSMWKFTALTTTTTHDNLDYYLTPLFNIQAANSSDYIATDATVSSTAGSFDLFNNATTGESTDVMSLDSYSDDARTTTNTVSLSNNNTWTVKLATTLSVTIGSTGYATINLPFAVTIPEGIAAYKVTAEETSSATLEEVSTTIPAGTPVILYRDATSTEATTHNFTIAYDNTDSAPTDNQMGGSLTPLDLTSGSDYILKNGNNGVGFYLITSTTDVTLAANKAYLPGSSSGAPMLSFDFGSQTGIANAATGTQTEESFYDLQGRRVLFPAHGIFVKGNGEKVYIK